MVAALACGEEFISVLPSVFLPPRLHCVHALLADGFSMHRISCGMASTLTSRFVSLNELLGLPI